MAGDKLAAGNDEVPGLPKGHEAQYAALMKQPANDVKKMLREIKLPLAGSKSQQVVRLVRELAGLPPVTEDEELFQANKKAPGKGRGRGRGRGRGKGAVADQEGSGEGTGEAEPSQVQVAGQGVGDREMDAAMKEMEAEVKAAAAAAPGEPKPKKAAAEGRLEKRGRGQPEPENSRKKSRLEEEEDVGAKQVSCPPQEKETPATTERGEPTEAGGPAKADDEADEDDDDDEEDPVMEGEGKPGAITVRLLEGQADLLQGSEGKWLSCAKEVLDADVELSLPVKQGEAPKEETEAPDVLPQVLRVTCPNGQQECEGDYELVPETLANGQPLWKSLESSRWLYSGTDGTWLVGGPKQKAQDFACRTGYLHLRAPHKGAMPHLAQGIWRRVDGKSWCEDLAVVVSKPQADVLCPGLPVCVSGLRKRPLRRLNGAVGRLLASEGKGWRVRLADGSEERLPSQNLERRDLDPGVGEAWLRPRRPAAAEGHLCEVFDALLQLAAEAEADADGQIRKVPKGLLEAASQLRVPEAASEAVTSTIGKAEKNLQVACVWRYEEQDDADEDLVPGAPGTAPYEGSRCPCTIKEVHGTKEVTVTWDYDGSEVKIPLKDLKLKLDKVAKARRQRRQWLRGAWSLVVLGGVRQRYVAAVQLLASVEDSCPGLWTSDLNLAVTELRRGLPGAEEETTRTSQADVDVEVRALQGPDAEPWLAKVAEAGRLRVPALRRASHAADCSLELMLPAGLFIVGTKADRPRALDYVRWLLAEGGPEAAAGRAERAVRGDVTVLQTVRGRSVMLERSVLKGIERETRTIIILEHGSGEAEAEGEEASTAAPAGKEDSNPDGPAQVHVCGSDPQLRVRAAGQVEGLLQAMAVVEEEPIPSERDSKSRRLEQELQEERRRREELEKQIQDLQAQTKSASAAATAAASSSSAMPGLSASAEANPGNPDATLAERRSRLPTDPVVEMRKLTYWPKDNQTWLSLQDIIWANHPPLATNWIRVWSRSKDHEYYVRLSDGKSSMNFEDARAR